MDGKETEMRLLTGLLAQDMLEKVGMSYCTTLISFLYLKGFTLTSITVLNLDFQLFFFFQLQLTTGFYFSFKSPVKLGHSLISPVFCDTFVINILPKHFGRRHKNLY